MWKNQQNFLKSFNILSWKAFDYLCYQYIYVEHDLHPTIFFLNRSKSGRVRSFGRTPVTLRSPQLTSASNRKYHGVIHIIITLTSLVCMLYVWSLLGLKTLKPECFFLNYLSFFVFTFFAYNTLIHLILFIKNVVHT